MQTAMEPSVQKIMLEQLQASKIHGFNFFAYTGIKRTVSSGQNKLILKLPSDSKFEIVQITLTPMDEYKIELFKSSLKPAQKTVDGLGWENLAETIVRELGVY